jgi:mono/diheme cytochrome c family protein
LGPARFKLLRQTALAVLAASLLLAAAAALTIYSGVYDVSAMRQHTAPVYWALEATMRQAVRRRAADITPPPLSDPLLVRRGLLLHRESCLQCHGAPGVSPHDAGKGLLPQPNNLAQAALEWSPAEIYWVTQNGLKMTGMPAWGMRYADADLWAIVAFVMQLPKMTAADYATMARSAPRGATPEPVAAGAGDAGKGLLALQQHACTTCHYIPGMVGSVAHVGPPLDGIAQRTYLAGRLPNSPENMVRWIRDPKSVSPATLMPDLGVSEQHARDMAAYLYLVGKSNP